MNTQATEPRIHREDGAVDVVTVYYTIQGEGPHSGCPAVFVRLAGCNLQCRACDTNYTRRRILLTAADVLREVDAVREAERLDASSRMPLVVLTGGEPMRQDLQTVVNALIRRGGDVQIETNGTYFQELPYLNTQLSIVCSPKTPQIHPQMERNITAWKYVLEAGQVSLIDGLPLSVLQTPMAGGAPARPLWLHSSTEAAARARRRIFVQPMDDLQDQTNNRANIQAAIDSALQFGYRVSLQSHKLLGLP